MKARKQDTPKAGEWILDSSRRLFITGARKATKFTRFNGSLFTASNGKILLLVSLRVRNAVPGKTMRIGIHGKMVSADGTNIENLLCDLPVDSAASLTAVLPSGAESKATLVFRVPKDFIPEKLQIELSNVGQLVGDKKTHDVLLTNCNLTATAEEFDVKTATKPPMPALPNGTLGGATQQNGDVQGKAGNWVSDGSRRVCITGIRRLDSYQKNNNKGQIKLLNPNQKLYVLTLLVQNTALQKVRVGLGYIASNLAGAEGDAIGNAFIDFPDGAHASGLSRTIEPNVTLPATLVWRGSAEFRPKAVLLHLSSMGNGVKGNPRIMRISLENCNFEADKAEFSPPPL